MAEAGGLAAYGTRIVGICPTQVSPANDQDLRGTAVAEIPVERPTAFELVINLRTAKTANLWRPASSLCRKVIEKLGQ
jgi:putative tryptophan/tyrosine transport system substrate-binding protein